jgi:hypothetical protein
LESLITFSSHPYLGSPRRAICAVNSEEALDCKQQDRKMANDTQGETLLVDTEAARTILGVSRRQFFDAIKTSGLPVVKLGKRKFQFHPPALRDWAAKQSRNLSVTA